MYATQALLPAQALAHLRTWLHQQSPICEFIDSVLYTPSSLQPTTASLPSYRSPVPSLPSKSNIFLYPTSRYYPINRSASAEAGRAQHCNSAPSSSSMYQCANWCKAHPCTGTSPPPPPSTPPQSAPHLRAATSTPTLENSTAPPPYQRSTSPSCRQITTSNTKVPCLPSPTL